MKIKVTSSITAKTIVGFYFGKVKEICQIDFYPNNSRQWGAYCSRVIMTKERLNISWDEYLKFVEDIFIYFASKNMKPVFGIICSNKVYHMYQQVKKVNEKTVLVNDFAKLQNYIYHEKYIEILKDI